MEREFIALIIVILASLAAVMGIYVLNVLFKDRLKELFDDKNYFIIFFLITGYILYALGEVAFYVTEKYSQQIQPMGIADVYWAFGAILILISFSALAYISIKSNENKFRFIHLIMFVGLLLVLVSYFLFSFTLKGEGNFFNYFYPLIGTLIVGMSLSAVIALEKSHHFSRSILIFSLASAGILLGDIIFTYELVAGTNFSVMLGLVEDLFYCLGYGLAAVAFLNMLLKTREADFQDSN